MIKIFFLSLLAALVSGSWYQVPVKIGDHVEGGGVYYVDETGRHGKVLAERPCGLFAPGAFSPLFVDTVQLAGFHDWHVPSAEELALAYKNIPKDRQNRVSVAGGGTFLTSTVAFVGTYDTAKKFYALFSLTNGVAQYPNQDSDQPFQVKLIRSF